MAKRMGRRRVLVAGGVAALALVSATLGSITAGGGGDEAATARLQSDDTAAFTDTAGQSEALATGGASESGVVAATDLKSASASGGAAPGDAQVGPLPPTVGAPSVVKTAVLEVEVDQGRFEAAFAEVPLVASTHGGFVASSTSSTAVPEDDRRSGGSLVLRVPADRFDVVRQELAELGVVRSEELRGDDVSAQLTDLDARLRNLRAQEDALRLLMTKTTNVGETIEVQRQLGGVREQIERLSAEQARVRDAVAMATITVSLREPGVSFHPRGGEPSVADAFERAIEGAERVVAGLIVSLGYVLPLALLAAAVWLAGRAVLRLRRAPPAPAPAGN